MVGALTAIVAVPMFILNSLAGIVGGIWLILLGDWKLVIAGFVVAVAAPFWASLLIMPGLIFTIPAVAAMEKGHTMSGTILASLSGLWTYGVVTGWCLVAFWYVSVHRHGGEPILPFLLFAYAVATAPWALLARKDAQSGGGDAAQLTTSAACIGCALLIAYVLFSRRPDFITASWFLIVPMVLMFLFSIFAAVVDARQQTARQKRGW